MARRQKASSKTRSQSSRQREETLRQLLKRERLQRTEALAREKDAFEQQAATSEILRVISSSPSDLQPVFDTIVRNAAALCEAMFANAFRYDGDRVHLVATTHRTRAGLKILADTYPMRPHESQISGRTILTKAPVKLEDALADSAYNQRHAKAGAWRRMLGMPMLRDGEPIGAIVVAWSKAGPIAKQHEDLLTTFADQAVIAIENVRLFNETKEALAQQTATANILRVIAGSPTNTQPVFDTVCMSAARLCNAYDAIIFRVEGEHLVVAGHYGAIPVPNEPLPLVRETLSGRAAIERRTIHMLDLAAETKDYPLSSVLARQHSIRTALSVPLIREGIAIGVIHIRRQEARAFSEKQIQLTNLFADQAVIAIENARLFNETKEALERQTATSDILRVISSSPADLQPVFDTIVRNFIALCGAAFGSVFTYDGKLVHWAGGTGLPPEQDRAHRAMYPVNVDDSSLVSARTIRARAPVHVEDALADAHYDPERAKAIGVRRILGVPMLREGEPLGALTAGWYEVGPTPKQHEELLRTFAAQAVIAIQNVRLFNETKEALEQQTATADILKVISSSPTDVQPVFDAIVQSAHRLFDRKAALRLVEADGLRRRAVSYASDEFHGADVLPIGRDSLVGRVVLDGRAMQVLDTSAPDAPPYARAHAQELNYRSIASAPLIREGKVIGVISVSSPNSGALSDKELALLTTFADQAVIAIENVRLFNETKEALERQTATAEILGAISNSLTNTQPVFDIIAERAVALCSGEIGLVSRFDGSSMQLAAIHGITREGVEALRKVYPMRLDAETATTRAFRTRSVVHLADVQADSHYEQKATAVAAGWRSALAVPMLRAAEVIGVIFVGRSTAGLFAQSQVELLKTFADQAVIAIENARLFTELQERTEALTKSVGQLTALGEVGQAISSTLDLETVLKTIVQRAVQLAELDGGWIYEYDHRDQGFYLRAAERVEEEVLEVSRKSPFRLGEGAVGRAGATREPVVVEDLLDPSYQSRVRELLIKSGSRALLVVPLLREDLLLGALAVSRKSPGPFAPDVINLLKTFATQSAVAIQNARLFEEIAEKGKQLEVASQHKSQFLASMSHELRTPLNAILGFNEMILDDVYGPVSTEVKSALEEMQGSGKHLLRLINNVLDLAKIEAGRMELALADYSVQDTVESVRSTLRPIAAEKRLELVTSLPTDLPLARGDAGRISQCLLNLAGNALKFTKEGKVEIGVTLDNGHLVYRVADTGIGIPTDKIESLFTEFKQTDATIASEYGGTGLGLSITKKFIEMHGGRIWVESEPGKGSTFTFEVPLRA